MKDQSKKVNANEALMGLIVLIIGVVYLIMTLQMREAAVGNPLEPKYFPLMISGLFIVLGLFFFLKTGPGHLKTSISNIRNAVSKDPDVYKMILLTSINAIAYGIFYKRLGYVVSTFLFLEVMLYLTRGKKWLSNSIISVVFSVIVYFLFSKLLGVMLPPMPFLDI